MALLDGYTTEDEFCEVFDGAIAREHYAGLVSRLQAMDDADLSECAAVVDETFRNLGITFAVYGGDEGIDYIRGQIVICDEDSAALPDLFDQAPVATEDPERDLQRNFTDGFCGWEARRDIKVSAEHCRRGAQEPAHAQAKQQNQPA